MDGKTRTRTAATGFEGHYSLEPLHANIKFYLGLDIGSTSSDIAVLDGSGKIIFCDYRRTKGRPIETIRSRLNEVFKIVNPTKIALAAATGSAGRLIAEVLDIPFINEVPAQAAAINFLYPRFQQATIIEMGGQDSKLIFLSSKQGHSRVRDFVLNTVCAAGTGSFLDQQAQRLGINIEDEFGRLALQSKTVPRMAGRCSVFAKSDMIHLQQQATPNCDIIAGLCLALARNLKSNLGCGREFTKPIIFTGGVAANMGVVRALEEVFELSEGELIVPDRHFFTGAIGAVLTAKKRNGQQNFCPVEIGKLDAYLARRGLALKNAPRREPLNKPSFSALKSRVYSELLNTNKAIKAYLGVDVGSISTNVVVINEQKQVLAKAYLMTAGKPLEAVREGLKIVGRKAADRVKILGAATTGSGRYLTGDFLGADIVINEITAQAAGAAIVNPKVDTIFEIGGQDSKYISLEDGVVVDFEMNHACAAGTGSFLEEQAQRLGINIDEEFARLAFKSPSPIKLGERCTVFMESDLLNYQQQGARTSELVAGLSYSIVTNYINRVVGHRKIGDNICFQGGTAFNKAVWSAFEKVTGKKILVPDHHEVTGALGAASIVAEHMKKVSVERGRGIESKFRGFENLISVKYTIESFNCDKCPNNCEIKKVQLPDTDPLYYGSRCDRYNLKRKQNDTKGFDAFEDRRRLLFELADLTGNSDASQKYDGKVKARRRPKAKIGIPMALTNWEMLPLFARFFKSLGFELILSGQTNKRIIRKGVECANAQTCFPVKVAYGHIAELFEKKVDYVFIPSIVSTKVNYPENKHNKLCPFVQSFPYQAKAIFSCNGQSSCNNGRYTENTTEILTVPLRFGEGRKLMRKTFFALCKKLGCSRRAVDKAIKEGLIAQEDFEKTLKQKGAEIIDKLGPDRKLFVLVSRPYNGCDEGVNLQLSKKLRELGMETIPMDMLDFGQADRGDKLFHNQIYWTYGQKILRAAEIIKKDKRLFAIYLSNFSCGPDSFLLTFFKDIMSPKPCLLLELDEHSADAGVITRLEAFLESLKHYRDVQIQRKGTENKSKDNNSKSKQRTICLHNKLQNGDCLYIPYMGDCSYGVASCFRSYGQAAEVMPIANQQTLLEGRKFTTGKECLPCAITSGDILQVIKDKGKDPQKAAFFMPGGNGPCRFGMYNCMHRLILRYAGADDVPVISPNQDDSFYAQFAKSVNGSITTGDFLKRIWASTVGIDLLRKLILRLRPYAEERQEAQSVYNNCLKKWLDAVEEGTTLSDLCVLCESFASAFAQIPLNRKIRKPRIGIVGEIYVRSHPFANRNIIHQFEKLGAACELAPLAEWVYYTNFTRNNEARRAGQIRSLFTNIAQNRIQYRIERILAEPLEKRFGKLAEEPVDKIINLARPYLHDSFEGEAILSVGKMIEYHHKGIGGVVNVMPFSCMPSTIVNSQTMRISRDCDGMPILNLSFDGQEDSTLTTRLEAFVEQVSGKDDANITISQLISV